MGTKSKVKTVIKWIVFGLVAVVIYVPQVFNFIAELNNMGDSISMLVVGMILSLLALVFLYYFIFIYGIGD